MRGLVAVAALLLAGCAPTCEQMCRKLERCSIDPAVDRPECQVSCSRELSGYRLDEDKTRRDRFNEHRQCIGASTCDELADGACVDGFEDLFPYGS